MPHMNKERAFFIDRDGVMCRMVEYESGWDSPQKPEDLSLVDGIVELVEKIKEEGFVVIEISNQPSVAKGKMSLEVSDYIEARMHRLLNERGVKIDYVYICHHHPKGVIPELTCECDCRKPKPGLIVRAAKELGIDLAESFFLGDKASDVEAGKAAGCKTILYLHEDDLPEKVEAAKKAVADFSSSKMGEIVEKLRLY